MTAECQFISTQVGQRWHHYCPACGRKRESSTPRYHAQCSAGAPAPPPRPRPSPVPPRANCVKLGDLVREIKLGGCCRKRGVYSCKDFGEAIPFGGAVGAVRCCQGCQGYQD